jgi:putative aldouronate transport system substrate-binding protein
MTADARAKITPFLTRNPIIGMIRFETDSNESIIESKLLELIKNENINIYMAESEEACEAAYNDLIAKAESIGLIDLEAYGNNEYLQLSKEYETIKANKE